MLFYIRLNMQNRFEKTYFQNKCVSNKSTIQYKHNTFVL